MIIIIIIIITINTWQSKRILKLLLIRREIRATVRIYENTLQSGMEERREAKNKEKFKKRE